MNKNMIKVFGYLFASWFFGLQSMQQTQQKDLDNKTITAQQLEQQHQVVEGTISLMTPAYYCGYRTDKFQSILDDAGNPLITKPQDVMVHCSITTNKDSDKLNDLPWWLQEPLLGEELNWLPLFLIDGKKEGDCITFLYKDRNNEILKIQLVCGQEKEGYSYLGGKATFQQILEYIKEKFFQEPMFHSEDLAKYIQDGILEEYNSNRGEPPYRHGPKGFKLEPKKQEAESKQVTADKNK